jgi:hypothetical protein
MHFRPVQVGLSPGRVRLGPFQVGAIAVAHVGTRNTHSPAEGSFFPAVW